MSLLRWREGTIFQFLLVRLKPPVAVLLYLWHGYFNSSWSD